MHRSRSFLLAIACGAVTACVLVACAGNTASPPTPSPAPTPTTVAMATTTAAVSTVAESATANSGSTVADVDCGPITAANGQKLEVVAKGSAAGVAGCTDAVDVLTEYFQRGNESQGTAHELAVQGWQCSTIDNGVTTEVITGCDKDGLSIQAVNR